MNNHWIQVKSLSLELVSSLKTLKVSSLACWDMERIKNVDFHQSKKCWFVLFHQCSQKSVCRAECLWGDCLSLEGLQAGASRACRQAGAIRACRQAGRGKQGLQAGRGKQGLQAGRAGQLD